MYIGIYFARRFAKKSRVICKTSREQADGDEKFFYHQRWLDKDILIPKEKILTEKEKQDIFYDNLTRSHKNKEYLINIYYLKQKDKQFH